MSSFYYNAAFQSSKRLMQYHDLTMSKDHVKIMHSVYQDNDKLSKYCPAPTLNMPSTFQSH